MTKAPSFPKMQRFPKNQLAPLGMGSDEEVSDPEEMAKKTQKLSNNFKAKLKRMFDDIAQDTPGPGNYLGVFSALS